MEGKIREGFVKTVDRLKVELKPAPVRPVFRAALHELITDIRRAGAEPIFVIVAPACRTAAVNRRRARGCTATSNS